MNTWTDGLYRCGYKDNAPAQGKVIDGGAIHRVAYLPTGKVECVGCGKQWPSTPNPLVL